MKAIRLGICALITFAVVSFGGVQPWGQAAVEIGSAGLFVLWGVAAIRERRAEIHWNWLFVPLLGLGAIAFVQWGFGLSVYAYLTKMELLRWAAHAMFFFLALQAFRSEGQVKQLAWFLLVLGFVVSLFGIVQHFTFNGNLYWLFALPAGASPFGPFVDADHFAGFIELITPLGVAWLLFRPQRPEQAGLLVLLTVVPIGAVILSASRGGILVLIGEFLALAFLSHTRGLGRKQWLSVIGVAVVASAFIVWLGAGATIRRFEQFAHERIGEEVRISMCRDTSRIFLDHPWMGTGLGTLAAVYPGYASFYNGRTVDHAHNDFLELLADTGALGGICGLCFVALLFWQGLRNLQFGARKCDRAIVGGALVGCGGLLLHEMIDFNLHIPSNALIFLVLAAIATVERRHPSDKLFRCA